MTTTIELRAFMGLSDLFRQRGWSFPLLVDVGPGMSGQDLLHKLDIPDESVEVLFVNGKASKPAQAQVRPGDRVALAPPGVPGPYRVLLGFKNLG